MWPRLTSKVRAYVKNHNLGLEVPYRSGSNARTYIPDFIVQVDDGCGEDDPLKLVVEIKGYRNEDAKAKKLTMETYWVPGVNNLRQYGRWAFAEFTDVYDMEAGFDGLVQRFVGGSGIPDYSALSAKELLASCPIDEGVLGPASRVPERHRFLTYLLDTNVISELRKGDRCDANVTAWYAGWRKLTYSLAYWCLVSCAEALSGYGGVIRSRPSFWNAGSKRPL